MFCPQCKAEYRTGFTQCTDCGVALVERLPLDPTPPELDHSELVVAETYSNELEAAVAKTALDAAGIDSMIRSDDSGGEAPAMQLSRGIQILVMPRDAEDARAVLSTEITGNIDGEPDEA